MLSVSVLGTSGHTLFWDLRGKIPALHDGVTQLGYQFCRGTAQPFRIEQTS